MTQPFIDLTDGPTTRLEWLYQFGIWGVGLITIGLLLVIAYRTLYMDMWSARWDYIGLHVAFGALGTISVLTCFWPGLRQTFIFFLMRLLLAVVMACYLSVTNREGVPFHVPGYQRRPKQPEPEASHDGR